MKEILTLFLLNMMAFITFSQNDSTVNSRIIKGNIGIECFGRENSDSFDILYYLKFSPQITFKQIPIGADLYYTNDKLSPSAFEYNLRYDIKETRLFLQEKITNKLLEQKGLNVEEFKKKYQKLLAYESFINDPSVKNLIDSIEFADNINDEITDLIKRKDSILIELPINSNYDSTLLQTKAANIDLVIDSLTTLYNSFLPKKDIANNFRKIYNDYSDIKDEIGDATEIIDISEWNNEQLFTKAKSMNLLPSWIKYFQNLEKLSLGLTAPDHSPLTLKNTNIKGLEVEYNFSKSYVNVVMGNNILPNTSYFDLSSFNSKVIASKVGMKNSNTDVFVSALYGKNEPQDSINENENFAIGIGFNSRLNSNINIEGHAGLSILVPISKQVNFINEVPPSSLQESVSFIFGSRALNGTVDKAANLKTDISLFNNNTNVTGQIEHVGAEYKTFGNYYLRSDINRWKFEGKQNLYRQIIKIRTSYSKGRDNLLSHKYSTTDFTRITAGFIIKPKGLPFVQVDYLPYNQSNEFSNLKSEAINITSGFNFKVAKGCNVQSTATIFKNLYRSNFGDTISGIIHNVYSTTHSIYSSQQSISINLSYMDQGASSENTIYGGVSVTSAVANKMYITLGGKFEHSINNALTFGYNTTLRGSIKKLGIYATVENNPFYDPEELVMIRGFFMRSGLTFKF